MTIPAEVPQNVADVVHKGRWRVRRYRDEDKPSLLRLSALHYGDREQAREEYVDWLAGGTPAGPAVGVVAEDITSGEIVGFMWNLPFRISFQGRSDLCYLGCNQLIHPDHRKRGIFPAMHDLVFKSLEDSLFKYGFPKPTAIGPLSKMGFFLVDPIPLLVRPLDIARLTQARIPNPLLRLAANLGWRVAGATVWRPRKSVSLDSDIRVSEESSFDERFDDFWNRVAHKYDIIVPRDRVFLNWRFRNLSFRTYSILAARTNGELTGYSVLRCVDVEGVRTGLIMDLLVEPTARGGESGLLLIEEATRRFGKAGMALAGCLMLPHTQEYALLRQTGYVECPERVSPQLFRLITVPLSTRAPREILAQADRWFITTANHDAV